MTDRMRALLVLLAMTLAALTVALVLPHSPLPEPAPGNAPNSTAPALQIALAPTPPTPATPEPVAIPAPPEATEPAPPPKPQPVPEPAVVAQPPPPEPAPVAEMPTEVTAATSMPDVQASATKEAVTPSQVELQAGRSAAADSYLGRLQQHLRRYFVYPRRAARLNQEGTPVVRFTFNRAGKLLEWQLQEASSYSLLNQAALDLLAAAEPLPPVPDDMSGDRFSFNLPVHFRLR